MIDVAWVDEARGRFLKAAGIAVLLLSLSWPASAQVLAGVLTGVACTPTITSPTTAKTYDAGNARLAPVAGASATAGASNLPETGVL